MTASGPSLRFIHASVFALALFLTATLVKPQPATAQQPAFDTDQPLQFLKQAVSPTPSDSQLVALATALQKARADTDISFHEYQEGVRFFKKTHPDFYGNFFGDPFYATYDIQYQKLTRTRRLVEPDINPQNSFRNSTWFFCWPSSYDPAFGGDCRGFRFAASDFWILPAGPAFATLNLQRGRAQERRLRTHNIHPRPPQHRQLHDSSPRNPDTTQRPAPAGPTPDHAESDRLASNTEDTADPVKPEIEIAPASAVEEIEVPDEVSSRMQERASALRRKEIKTRIRRELKRQYGAPGNLDPRERARLANRLAETKDFPNERVDESPETRNGTEQIDQSEIRDRIRRLDRPENGRRSGSRSERATSPRDRQLPDSGPGGHRSFADDQGGTDTPDVDPPAPNRSQNSSGETSATDDSG